MVPTKHPEIWRALAAPFDIGEVKTRVQGGRQLSFISARSAMNRLDEVFGGENWRDSYTETTGGLKCRIEYRLPGDPEWLWKEDGGAGAGMPEADNQEKSAYSDAFKRACVKLGVGRYLYRDGVPCYSDDPPAGDGHPGPPPQSKPTQPQQPANGHGVPRTGKALYAWCREQEDKSQVGLIKHLNTWAKVQDFPSRMVDWSDDQASLAYQEAARKLQWIAPAVNPDTVGVGSQPDLPEPDGTVPKPATGKDLWGSASDHQQRLGITLIRPMNEFMRARGVKGQCVDWTGDALDLAWRFVSATVSKAIDSAGDPPAPEKPKGEKAPKLNLEVWSKATAYLAKLFAVDVKQVAPEAVFAEINRVYGQLYPADVIESFRDFREQDRLAVLGRCFDELIAEQLELPAF